MSTWSQGLTALVTACGLLLSGCSPAPSPSPTPTLPLVTTWTGSPEEISPTWATDLDPASEYGLHKRKGLDPILRPETMVLDAAAADRISAVTITNSAACLTTAREHPMCEFAISFSSLPPGLAVGSVVNAGITRATPNGLLAKVTAIDQNQVTAVQASLVDALVQGEFWVERALNTDELRAAPTLAPGVTIVPRKSGGLRKSVPGSMPTFDGVSLPGELSIDTSPVSGVHLGGTLDFGAGCGLDGGVGGSDIAWMEIGCNAWESASLTVTSTKATQLSEKEIPLAIFPLAGFPIPVGPLVIIIVIDIVVSADLTGQVHVGLSYGGHERTEVRGGLKFSLGHGLDHDGGVKVTAGGHGGGLKQDASVTALGRATLRISAYGVLGIGVGGDASVTLTGGPTQSPRWRILGNAGLFVEIFLGILGFKLSAYIRYHLKQDFLIASGGNASPKLTVAWPKDGATIARGGLMPPKVDASALDPEDGALPVRWQDLTDNVTVEGTGPQTLPFKKLGPHALKVSTTDSEGATAEQVLTVTVKAAALSLSLRLLRIDGTAMPSPPSGRSGATLLADAVVTSGQLTPPSCAALVWSATNATVTSDGSCRARVVLGQPGTATVNASIIDTNGTSAEASITTNVSAAGAGTTPQFLGIDATAAGRHLTEGDSLLGDEPVQLSVTYLNHDQAKVTPSYTWTYTTGSNAPTGLPGGRELLSSTRSYTPPSPWGHKATFTVVIRDAATKAVLANRSFAVTWQSLPK